MLIVVQGNPSSAAEAAIDSALTFAAFEQDVQLLFLKSALSALEIDTVLRKLGDLALLIKGGIFVENDDSASTNDELAQISAKLSSIEAKAVIHKSIAITSY